MDFARQQLEKYGWKDGEGLGKSRNGISNPIKAKLKFDNSGLGHNIADELVNPWWQRVYDKAAENVNIEKQEGSVKIETKGETEITTKKRKSKKRSENNEKYGNFVRRAALTGEGEQRVGSDGEEDLEDEPKTKKRTSGICELTDDELFKACGGRTVHKGARHGLSMSAKLARSAQLEEEELKRIKSLRNPKKTKDVTKGEDVCKEKEKKKKRKKKVKNDD